MLIAASPKVNKLNLLAAPVNNFIMKRLLYALLLLPLLLFTANCDKDSNRRNVNPYLPQYSFSVSINMNLPQYASLRTPMNPVSVNLEGAGISGLIVMRVSDTDYRCWEAACPNQYPTPCSRMTFDPGDINCECSCENFNYSLLTGIGGGSYTMQPYRYEIQGDVIRVYN